MNGWTISARNDVISWTTAASHLIAARLEQLYAHVSHLHRPWSGQIHNRRMGGVTHEIAVLF